MVWQEKEQNGKELNMFSRKTSCLVFLVFLCYFSIAQEREKKITFDCEVKALLGSSVRNLDKDYAFDGTNTYGKSIRLLIGYNIYDDINLALGFGADRYEGISGNTIPLTLRGRYNLTSNNHTPFVQAEAGLAIPFSEATEQGHLLNICMGYKWTIKNHFALSLLIGYNTQTSYDVIMENDDIQRKSMILGLSLNF